MYKAIKNFHIITDGDEVIIRLRLKLTGLEEGFSIVNYFKGETIPNGFLGIKLENRLLESKLIKEYTDVK